MTNPILVAVVNESTMLHDTAVSNVVAHLQTQIKRDFTPIWGIAADVWFYPSGSVVPANAWQMVVLDNSDQAGALGYHELTATGQPLAKIFVKDTVGAGDAWSVTMSHELCEMLVDPNTNLTVFNQSSNTSGELIVYETCLTGDTKISLLDGTEQKLEDLINKEYFWVYSINEDGNIRPGKAHSVKKTKSNTNILKITLDNGESFKCTPDHKILLRDGTYTEAQYLVSGTSLMPLYRRDEFLGNIKTPYEQVYNPLTNDWKFTHIVKDNCSLCKVINHKVVSIENWGTADVYDLVVDKYHNFALSAGIFVHNCDPVEDDQYGYAIGSIRVSDFVTPNYFIPGSTGPWDFGKHLTAPLQIITGGYLAVFNVNSGSGWTQIFGKKNSGWKQYTRSKDGKLIKSDVDANDKRFIPRSEWKTSLK